MMHELQPYVRYHNFTKNLPMKAIDMQNMSAKHGRKSLRACSHIFLNFYRLHNSNFSTRLTRWITSDHFATAVRQPISEDAAQGDSTAAQLQNRRRGDPDNLLNAHHRDYIRVGWR